METWDNTKLASYTCEMRGHYAMERHLVPKEPAVALAFGLGIHAARETWIKSQIQEPILTSEVAVIEAKRAFLVMWEKELPLDIREVLEFSEDRRSYANFCRLFEAYVSKFPITMYDKIVAVETPFTLFLD